MNNITPERACQGKQRHASRKAARTEILLIARKKDVNPSTLSAYACLFCSWWHVGHKLAEKRRPQRREKARRRAFIDADW